MSALKVYNPTTAQWEYATLGKQGDTGITTSATAPTNTNILWMDTTDAGSQVAVPSGGSTGQTLVKASDVDYNTAWVDRTGMGNAVINGAFDYWQRGTSFTTGNGAYVYTADRWQTYFYASNSATVTQQALTPGSIPVAGYEGTYFLRMNSTSTSTVVRQLIEDVRTFAGQTVTLSFWAKAASAITLSPYLSQNFGSGGSAAVDTATQNVSVTTSWQRFSLVFNLPSISGKTVGTNSFLALFLFAIGVTNVNIDIWGVQLEAGTSATPFRRAGATIQAEIAACQRYYWRAGSIFAGANFPYYGLAVGVNTTSVKAIITNPVPMRVSPTSVGFSTVHIYDTVNAAIQVSSITFDIASPTTTTLTVGVASGVTQYRSYFLLSNSTPTGYLEFSAEL